MSSGGGASSSSSSTQKGKASLAELRVDDLGTVKEIFSVSGEAPVVDAMNILFAKNVLSIPVENENKEFYAFIDLLDIVTFMVHLFDETALGTHNRWQEELQHLAVLEQGERFTTTKVKEIAGLSERNPFIPVKQGEPLLQVLEILGKKRVHRVPIVNEEGKVVNIVTQSAVVDHLAKHMSALGPIVNTPLKELGVVGKKKVITVSIDSRTIDAYKLMHQHKISAIAVVDADGHLVANVSTRDIRAISTDSSILAKLYQPISHFLTQIHMDSIDIVNPAISCSMKDALGLVLGKLAVSKVHRIYIVDAQNQPIDVISLSDILVLLSSTAAPSSQK
ncbi:hypothetical protein QOT17_007372 [Balamuthia mandrillaris]